VGTAENATRLCPIKPAASGQHALRVVARVNRAAGEYVIAAKKAHFLRPARQKNFEAAGLVGTKKNNGGSRARMNHRREVGPFNKLFLHAIFAALDKAIF